MNPKTQIPKVMESRNSRAFRMRFPIFNALIRGAQCTSNFQRERQFKVESSECRADAPELLPESHRPKGGIRGTELLRKRSV